MNILWGEKLLTNGPELRGGGYCLPILREVTLRERDRKRVALCKFHANMYNGGLLQLLFPKTLSRKGAHLGQNIRFAAPKNIINRGREHPRRAARGAKRNEKAWVRGGGLTTQAHSLQRCLGIQKMSLQQAADSHMCVIQPKSRGPQFPRPLLTSRIPLIGACKKTSRSNPSDCENVSLVSRLQIPHFLMAPIEIT